MGSKAKDEITESSARIIDYCQQLASNSGMAVADFISATGLSPNYWYKRMRHELPFNTSDIDHIAAVAKVPVLSIYAAADSMVTDSETLTMSTNHDVRKNR